jgi:hypothetical protein
MVVRVWSKRFKAGDDECAWWDQVKDESQIAGYAVDCVTGAPWKKSRGRNFTYIVRGQNESNLMHLKLRLPI